jgi:hypothetical protein
LESLPQATVASAISAASAKKVREYFCGFIRISGWYLSAVERIIV